MAHSKNKVDKLPAMSKLPVWARGMIKDLVRERDEAQKLLKDYLNTSNDPSPFFTRGFHAGTVSRRYIQTESMSCEYKGLQVEIQPLDDKVRVFFRSGSGTVALIPQAANLVEIVRIPE